MSFWKRWFGPKCEGCGERITGEPRLLDERSLCTPCFETAQAEQAEAEAELEARRAAEEEARRKLEERKTFGR